MSSNIRVPNTKHLSPGAEINFELPVQRTEAGLAYERFYKHIHSLSARVGNKEARIKLANEEILRCKTLGVSDVQVSTVLSEMSMMYANDEYIGSRVMPFFDIGKRIAEYYEYTKRDRFAAPDDAMDTRTEANEVGQGRSKKSVSLEGRALKEFVDQVVLNNQDTPLNELMDAQNNVLELLALAQEQRIATVCTTGGNFGGNTVAIAAADRWDTAAGGDPVKDINTALAAMWNGRGPGRRVAVCSLNVWNVLKVHPRLLDMIRGNRDGMLTRDAFAQWFEIDELLVGKARKDTANEGQTASYSRIWPDTFGVYRVGLTPSRRNAVFGWTYREKPPVQRMWFDPKSGEEGGWWTQASFADKAQTVAGDAGYLITTPIL